MTRVTRVPSHLYFPIPEDKTEPGFMLDIAENTGDGFAYVLLPVKSYADIQRVSNPTTLN